MTNYKHLLVALAGCFIAASCSNVEEDADSPVVENDNVSFTASMKAVARATETAFEEKDEIVVYAVKEDEDGETELKSSGNYANHVRYTYTGGRFTNANGIVQPTGFGVRYFAIYPYSSVTSVPAFKFNVKSNQNMAGQYTLSDLCTAVSDITAEKDVDLTFSHRLSHVVVNLEGESLGTGNASVRLNDVHTGCEVNLNNNTFTAYDSKHTVYCTDNGTNCYKAIIVPQTIEKDTPFLTVTLNGKEYTMKATNDLQFTSGKQQTFNLVIEKDEIVTYTSSILPWGESEEVEEREAGIYSLEDLVAFRDARNAGEDVSMWKNGQGEINIYADIDMSASEWTPISELASNETINGNGHTIKLKKTAIVPYEKWGLVKTNKGEIKNLDIEVYLLLEETFSATDNVGKTVQEVGIFCYENLGKIVGANLLLYGECKLKSVTFGGFSNSNSGTIEKCTTAGTLFADMISGGFCSENRGMIKKCINSLEISSGHGVSIDCAGGITGYNLDSGEIYDCVNKAGIYAFVGAYGIGGIVGRMFYGKVEKCVNEGNVEGGYCQSVGGIVGNASETLLGDVNQGMRIISCCTNNGFIWGDEKVTGGIVGCIAGAESTIVDCIYGGTVNYVAGSEINAIGTDLRQTN